MGCRSIAYCYRSKRIFSRRATSHANRQLSLYDRVYSSKR